MKRLQQILVVLSAVAFATLLSSAYWPAETNLFKEGLYFIQMRHSGKYISVKNAGKENGTILWQWDFHGKTQQQFKFKSAGNGYYFIKAKHSGKYVSVKNAGQENGTTIWQWDYHGKSQQQFAIERAEGDYYYIKARHSGKYLSIKSAGKENGTILWQWDFHGKAQQQFKLTTVLANGGGNGDTGKPQFARAKRVGGSIGCGSGEFEDNGACFTCPSGTTRTVFAVTSDKACERAGGDIFKPATRHGKGRGLLGTDCNGGQFFDPNGYCYSCPQGYNRTAHPVTSGKACSQRVHAEFMRATRVRNAAKCPSGSFYDITKGTCYSCPSGYNRTVFPIDGAKACERNK